MHLRLDHAGCRISTFFAFIRAALGIVTIFSQKRFQHFM